MRTIQISNTSTDLAAAAARTPFLSQHTVVGLNFTAGTLIVQESDDDTNWTAVKSSNAVAGTVRANGADELVIRKRYVRVSTAANITLIAN